MSPLSTDALSSWIGFPRVSGDEPNSREAKQRDHLFSPRERG